MLIKRIKMAGALISLLLVAACGSGGGGGAVVTAPITGTTSVQSDATGATAATASVALPTASLGIPAGTTLKAADGTPVSGDVKVTMTYGTNPFNLPIAEVTSLPAGTLFKAYVDIQLSAGDKAVKTVNPPIPVAFNVALADGMLVDIYSYNGSAWVKEASARVFNGKVSFTVSHFSPWIAVQSATGSFGASGS